MRQELPRTRLIFQLKDCREWEVFSPILAIIFGYLLPSFGCIEQGFLFLAIK